MVSRGEIRWAVLPGTGRRPVLVMTRDVAIPVLTRVLAAPLTRTVRGIATDLSLDESDGLPGPCAASFDNLVLIDKSLLGERIACLGEHRMTSACRALRFATGC